MTECLRELLEISDHYSGSSYTTSQQRKEALYTWFHKWIMEVSSSQLIVRQDLITAEISDHIKTQLVINMSETLLERAAAIESSKMAKGTEMKATMYVLRKRRL